MPFTTMQTGYTRISGGRIFWRQWGGGAHLLICLHGFADTGERFGALAAALPENYTLIAPDMPWHGQTEWNKKTFDPWDVQEIIDELRRLDGRGSCVLLGHSWGGRLALAALPLLAERVASAWVVAPGGFDAGSKWGGERLPGGLRRCLIRSVETHTRSWVRMLEKLVSIGLVKAPAFRFFQSSIEAPARKERLLAVWKNLHHFRLRKSALQQVRIPMHFLVGDRDPLVSPLAVRRFSRSLPNARFIFLPDSGHWPEGEAIAKEIVTILQ